MSEPTPSRAPYGASVCVPHTHLTREGKFTAMTQSTITVIRLVGNRFRHAGAAVLPTLPAGHPLILEPEPTNPHDPNAIRVLVELSNSKSVFAAADRTIHLGYIPRVKTSEVMSIIQGPDWRAYLVFDMQGEPMVRIEQEQEG